jgi:hypothetical protein
MLGWMKLLLLCAAWWSHVMQSTGSSYQHSNFARHFTAAVSAGCFHQNTVISVAARLDSQQPTYLHNTNHIAKVPKVQVVAAQLQRFQRCLAPLLGVLGAAKHYECALVITGLLEGDTAAVRTARCVTVSHIRYTCCQILGYTLDRLRVTMWLSPGQNSALHGSSRVDTDFAECDCSQLVVKFGGVQEAHPELPTRNSMCLKQLVLSSLQ